MCHHRTYRHDYDRDVRPIATRSPAGPIRIGDAERERTVELLRTHAAAGRLDPDELEEHLERAYRARYAADLDDVLAELPPEPESRRRADGPGATPLLPVALIALLVVAGVTGAWWLLWLILPLIVLGPRHHHPQRGARV
jgi:Domain of unknown function (DUF1707)